MTIVIDASFAAAFVLPDENSALVVKAIKYFKEENALVPSIFWHEIRNALLSAERRQRIEISQIATFLSRLRALLIEDAGAGDDHEIFRVARTHGLSAYDASYLALACVRKVRLATFDGKLRRAAQSEKVALFA